MDSDVDPLVIMSFNGSPLRQAVEVRGRINAGLALDPLVRTSEEVKRRLEMGDSFTGARFLNADGAYKAAATPNGGAPCSLRLLYSATMRHVSAGWSQPQRGCVSEALSLGCCRPPDDLRREIRHNPDRVVFFLSVAAQGCCTRLPSDTRTRIVTTPPGLCLKTSEHRSIL
jgi:hypothetical protein